MPANPDAIAWYLQRSESLLKDLRERVLMLRTRGAQLAGFAGAVLALAGANVNSVLGGLEGACRDLAGGSLLVGFFLLVLCLVTVLRGTLTAGSIRTVSAKEVANFTTERFTDEPELWRVHLRTIHGLLDLIELTTIQGDDAERALEKSEYFFLAGLFAVAGRLGYLGRGDDALIFRLLKRKKKKRFVGPVKPEHIPWDVPLDQTKPKFHRWGDITSV